jgi:hypothetical protein
MRCRRAINTNKLGLLVMRRERLANSRSRARGSHRERASRPASLQGEVRVRRQGSGAARRRRPDVGGREGLHDDERPLAAREPPRSPGAAAPRDERIVRPGKGTTHSADPADPDEEPA